MAIWVEMFRKQQLYLNLTEEIKTKNTDFGYTCKELMIQVLVDYYPVSSLISYSQVRKKKLQQAGF